MNSQAKLLDKLCANIAPGKLEWIGLRSERRGEVVVVDQVEAVVGLGLASRSRLNISMRFCLFIIVTAPHR